MKSSATIGPSHIRKNNVKIILELLNKEHLGNLELAQKMDISGAAINKILKQLSSLNIIEVVPDYSSINAVGRKHIRYRLSDHCGLYVILDLTQFVNKLIIKNYSGKIVLSKHYVFKIHENDYITEADIKKIVHDIKQARDESNLPIYAISISTPGQFDERLNEFILSRKFDLVPKDYLYKILIKTFKCKIIVKNNVHMMAIGEYKYGQLRSEYNTSLFLYLGFGIAACAIYKGEIIQGWRGYAGEIGYNRTNEDTYLSYASLHNLYLKYGDRIESQSMEALIKAYHEDEVVAAGIRERAISIAEAILSMTNILGCDTVVLSGEVLELGDKYVNTIKEFVKQYAIPNMKIRVSEKEDLAVLGCDEVARKFFYENVLDLKEVKKTTKHRS